MTPVLFSSYHCRYHGVNYDKGPQPSFLPWNKQPEACWRLFLYYNQFEDAIILGDRWLWEILRWGIMQFDTWIHIWFSAFVIFVYTIFFKSYSEWVFNYHPPGRRGCGYGTLRCPSTLQTYESVGSCRKEDTTTTRTTTVRRKEIRSKLIIIIQMLKRF